MRVAVEIDFKKTFRAIERYNQRQIPFAAAVTLTRLAQGSQLRIRSEMDKFFNLRSKRRMLQGVRIKPARKADFKRDTMHSEVNDIDRFMPLHVTGGIKRPGRHRYVAIPRDDLLAQGARTATGKIKKRLTPRAMIAKIKATRIGRPRKKGRHRKPRPFLFESTAGLPFIAVRVGPERKPLKYLWGMSSRAKIDKTWPFVQTVEQYVLKNAGQIFSKEFKRALAASGPA